MVNYEQVKKVLTSSTIELNEDKQALIKFCYKYSLNTNRIIKIIDKGNIRIIKEIMNQIIDKLKYTICMNMEIDLTTCYKRKLIDLLNHLIKMLEIEIQPIRI